MMINLAHFSLYVDGHYLLRDISLSITAGNILTIIGASGAGKSTLLKALMGAYVGTPSGVIDVAGRNIIADSAHQRRNYRRYHAALVSQSTAEALNPQLTVMQHLLETWRRPLATRATPRTPNKIDAAEACLRRFHVPATLWQRRPRGLSGGEIQRVLLAMAMINNPDILLLDEPSSALDETLQRQLQQAVIDLSPNRCVVWVRHDLALAREMPGDIAVMHRGRIVEYQRVSNLFTQPQHLQSQQLIQAAQCLSTSPLPAPRKQQRQDRVLTLRNVAKYYGNQCLFDHLNFNLYANEIIALFGDSGVGKSTLARILSGWIRPDCGEVRHNCAYTRVAWIAQHPIRALPPHFTLLAAVAEPLQIRKYHRKTIWKCVLSALADMQLATDSATLNRAVHTFSGGELQRIALARALVAQPQIIIADEITASLDHHIGETIIQQLLNLQQQQQSSMVFITHNEILGKRIADRCLWLRAGELHTEK